MKFIRNPFRSASVSNVFVAGSIVLSFALPSAQAATYFWDSDGIIQGAGATPTGTWGTDAFWSTLSAGTAVTTAAVTTTADDVFFCAGSSTALPVVTNAFTVTLNGTQNVRLATFQEGIPSVTGGTLNLGSTGGLGGITVLTGSGDAAITSNLALTGNLIFDIGASRTLGLSTGTFTRNPGAVLNVRGTGVVNSTLAGLSANNAAGAVGTWATFGTTTATQYATFSGASIAGLAGTAAADGTALTDVTGLVNYNLATFGGTVPAGVSANTIRYTGATGTTAPGAGFSVNGLLNAGSSGPWIIGTNTLTIGAYKELVINAANASMTISSVIQNNAGGASGLTKAGASTLTLSGANSYTGNTIINHGTLAITNANALGDATGTTSIAAAGNNSAGGRLSLSGGITVPENFTISGNTEQNSFLGAIESTSGTNTLSGTINLSGTSQLRIASSGTSVLNLNGAINRVGTDVGSLTLNPSATSAINVNQPIDLNGGSLNVQGAGGTVTLNAASSDIGSTTISFGGAALILKLGLSNALPNNKAFTIGATGTTLNGDKGVFDLAGFDQTLGSLTGTVNTSTTPGLVTERLIMNSGAGPSTLAVGTLNTSSTFNGVIQDNIAITKVGTATLTLSGPNTYTGNTNINVGSISISNPTSLGDTTGTTTIAATGTTATGGRLIITGSINSAENLILTGDSETTGFNPTIDSNSGTNILSGNITLSGTGGQRITTTAGSLDLNGTIARNGANSGVLVLRTGVSTATMNVNNSIDLNGGGMNIQGLGTVVLNAASTDLTSATIGFGGPLLTMKLGIASALPDTIDLTIGSTGTTVAADQGTIDLAGFNQTAKALNGLRGTSITPSDATTRKITNSNANHSILTAGNTTIEANINTFDGVIEDGATAGGVALTKVGAGTLVLSGPNTYTGATTITTGTLRVTGSLAAGSAVTVGAAATLSGIGPVSGTVNASGIIAPGVNGVGTLTTGTTTLTGTLAVEIDGATGDKLTSTGAVSLSGPLTVTLLAGGFTQPSYVIASGTSITGTFSSVPSGYAVTYSATQATLTQAAGSDYTTWATAFGLQNPWLGINPALNGTPAADPDGDGMNNQQEYAFGLTPTSSSSVNPITVQLDKTTGTFRYTRRATPAITGLVYTVKTSQDLVTWTIDAAATSTQSVIGTAGDVQTVAVTITGAPLTAPKLFFRMQAN